MAEVGESYGRLEIMKIVWNRILGVLYERHLAEASSDGSSIAIVASCRQGPKVWICERN